MEDEKKDERARQATCEMDEEKHGPIVKAHLPISELFDIFLVTGLILDPSAQDIENDIVR